MTWYFIFAVEKLLTAWVNKTVDSQFTGLNSPSDRSGFKSTTRLFVQLVIAVVFNWLVRAGFLWATGFSSGSNMSWFKTVHKHWSKPTICQSVCVYLQQEELSEQQVRVGLVDKKLENATKDGDERVVKIQRKLDEATIQLKKKEK